MDLKVIGAGFGRTGTLSLKLALEQLGFNPCYHMIEVFSHPGHSEQWLAAARGENIDWDTFLAGYKSAVDWPSCHFWRELSAHFPDAKVILTEREPHAWFKSITETIFLHMNNEVDESKMDPIRLAQRKMGQYIVSQETFGNRFDETHVLDVYRHHNEEVKRTIPPARLLTYDASQGWEPLCHFLGVPVPETPYPKTNTTEDFKARIAARR